MLKFDHKIQIQQHWLNYPLIDMSKQDQMAMIIFMVQDRLVQVVSVMEMVMQL